MMVIYSSIGIFGSVGRAGQNGFHDVRTVQQRLNDLLGQSRPRLAVDGISGPKTEAMIADFQSNVLRFRRPDARVDPSGRTIVALNDPNSANIWQRMSVAPLLPIAEPQQQQQDAAKPVSAYELAYLSRHVYRPDENILPMGRMMNIEGAGAWGIHFHTGISNSFFCTKYIKAGTLDEVIVFRGTDIARLNDLRVDAQHLLSRNSDYIDSALNFLNAHGGRNTIVAGHSLGGFIAITMAFKRTVRAVAFNPPWMGGALPAIVDQLDARGSQTFRSSRIIVYQSRGDLVTGATHVFRIRTPNLRFVHVGASGHGIDDIVLKFSQNVRFTQPLRM